MRKLTKLIKYILKIISYIIPIIIIISFIYFILNYKIYIVATGSMEPTLQINELIVVKLSKEDTTYAVGDIITYYDNEINIDVTHRIVELAEGKYYTKGDNNNTRDLNAVTEESIIGKVIYNSYFLGYLYVNYRYIILALVVIAIIALNMLFTKPKNKKTYKLYNYDYETTNTYPIIKKI